MRLSLRTGRARTVLRLSIVTCLCLVLCCCAAGLVLAAPADNGQQAAAARAADTGSSGTSADRADGGSSGKEADRADTGSAGKGADGDQALSPEEEQKRKEAEAKAKFEAEARAKAAQEAERKQEQTEATEKKIQEVAELTENDPWEDLWIGQRSRIENAIEESTRLSENFFKDIKTLDQMNPVEQDIRRLLIMVNDFKQWPAPLEAVNRRLGLSFDLLQSIFVSAAVPQYKARELLEQLNASAENVAELAASHNDEVEQYLTKINTARFLLTAIISRYASVLAPVRALTDRVQETRAEITKQLPQLWMNYYTRGPVSWLSVSEWSSVPGNLSYFTMGMSLRKYVEVPLTSSQWQSALTRFFITLIAMGCLSFLMASHLLMGHPKVLAHVKRHSLPWNVLGVALLAAAYTPSLEPYRLFMALGNLSLILGQVTLAWELRRTKYTDVEVERSPLFQLLPLTLAAYVLLYLPFPRIITLALWLLALIANIWWLRRKGDVRPELGRMHLETSILDLQPLILWPCLIVCLAGFHFYSMAIYLLFSSISIAVQISVASLSFISSLNESLSKDDTRTMFASFILAIAAPVVLLLALAVVSLWLATLPGGLDLLQFYIFKSVNIGETQLNLVQVLLIATAFFLARTASRMGKSFIGRLPSRGFKLDPSLVTPMQTGYSYGVWCLFGLFVLRSLGMNLSNLAVIAGGLSVGIGFGMQTIVNNFISGIILIFSRTLQVGDIVEVGKVVGRIKHINVRATVVETYDSATIYVPNSAFVSGNLTNWTSNSRTTRQQVLISVAYGSDTQLVVKTLLDIANKHSDVLAYPKPSVQFQNFGASTLDFRLLFWVRDYDIGTGVASDIRFRINQRFAEENIEIAFPQMDVHVRDVRVKTPALGPGAVRAPRRSPSALQPGVRARGRAMRRRSQARTARAGVSGQASGPSSAA